MRRLLQICRQAVYPRLTDRENYRASTCVLGMLAVIGAMLCIAELVSLLAA